MQRIFRTMAAISLCAGAVLAPSVPVGAQADSCDDLIDLYGVADPDGLRSAIADAEAETGIDFHVFAIDTLAAGQDLDAASFANCPGAYIVPGEVANDTVVLAVSVETRDFNVVYGENLRNRLDDDVDVIFERMAAWFQNGDFGQGLSAGVDEAVDGLATEPSNTLGWVVGGVGVAAGIGGAGAGVAAVRRKNQREKAEAAARYDAASSEVTEVQARWYDAEQSASLLGGRLTGVSLERLEQAQNDAAVASRRLYDAWSPVSELDGTAVAELDDAAQSQAFSHVAAAATIAKENAADLQAFETTLAEFDGSVEELATLHTHGTGRIAAGRAAAVTRSAEGWDVAAADQRLDQLDAALGRIDAFALRLDVDTLRPTLAPLVTEADSIATDLEQLDERRDAAALRRSTVGSEADGQLHRVAAAGEMIDRWKLAHSLDSFDDFLQHPAEAAKQLERAQQHLVSANNIGDIPRSVGVLRDVTADLDAADVAVDLADELLDELDELDVDLAAALRDAPEAVVEARAEVQVLNDFVSAKKLDLAPPAHEFAREVAEDLAEAEAALGQSPPDSLLAIALAEDIGEEVDTKLATFKARVDERERVRNAAVTQMRAAQNAIDRADRHVDSHVFSGRQSKNAQGEVDRLRAEFASMSSHVQTDPERVLSESQRIANIADQIYTTAQNRQRRNSGGGVVLGAGSGRRGYRSSSTRSRSRSRSSSRSRSRSRARSSSRRSGGRRGKF